MSLKFQLNIDTAGLTPAQLAAAVQRAGRDISHIITAQSADKAAIERHQCAPVFAGPELVGNWRIITS